MFRKVLLGLVVIFFSVGGTGAAQSLQFDLSVGSTSVAAGIAARKEMTNGYMKVGLSGVYTDDDELDYQWVDARLMAGNDTVLLPGLSAEIGIKGIFGSVDKGRLSGDLGAVAFVGRADYLLPIAMIPLPLKVFGAVSYSPTPLSFQDTETYLEMNMGVGVQVLQNASIEFSYNIYDIDFESGRRDWTLDEEVIRLGVSMRF